MEALLKMEDVTKIYGGVTALNHVSLDLMPGEILALVGENGAGKSTLIKSLSGAVIPDAGTITMEGKTYQELNPTLSKEIGIAVVYQELTLCKGLTVYENIYLGSFAKKAGFVNKKEMIQGAQALLDELNIPVDAWQMVSNLSVAYMQLIEIAKAVSRNSKVLILDEPTASLTNAETDILFTLIRKLKEKGTSIIYISHRLSEVFALGDRVVIMRDGHKISTHRVADITEQELIQGMIGRELTKTFPTRDFEVGEVVFKVENLTNAKVSDVSFELHRGEVLGLGGLVGAGRTEIVRTIFGADPKYDGKIYLNGEEINPKNPRQAVQMGISMVPEDRKAHGVILDLPIMNNICLSIYNKISRGFFVQEKKEEEIGDEQQMREIERIMLLKVIDRKWTDHIDDMDRLKQGIGLQSLGQRDPVVEYKFAGYDMFNAMTASIQEDTVKLIMRVKVEQKVEREEVNKVTGTNKDDTVAKGPVKKAKKIGRNDPCPCGSGKKYKNCCGRDQ